MDLSYTDVDMDTDYKQQKTYYKLWAPWHVVDVHGEPGSADSEKAGGGGVGVPEPLQMPVLLLSVVPPELGHLLLAHQGYLKKGWEKGQLPTRREILGLFKITLLTLL